MAAKFTGATLFLHLGYFTSATFTGRRIVEDNAAKLLGDPAAHQDHSD